MEQRYFNPRSPHGERPAPSGTGPRRPSISIHAPRTGSDKQEPDFNLDIPDFNPRSPHGERRPATLSRRTATKFQSTLPARGATCAKRRELATLARFQSTLPARGATLTWQTCRIRKNHFNPRSPHGERPRWSSSPCAARCHFNPRSPHGERRKSHFFSRFFAKISIHAPRTGSDASACSLSIRARRFQSTLPARGATVAADVQERGDSISIHAPRTGSDCLRCRRAAFRAYFNPRSPHGERQGESRRDYLRDISIHAPRTGSDAFPSPDDVDRLISIHAPRTGSDVAAAAVLLARTYFNPRSPHGERLPPR